MVHIVRLYKTEVVCRLMEEAALMEKPFGPFMAELFPADEDQENHERNFTGIIIPQVDDGEGGVRKLDPAHTAIPLKHMLNLTGRATVAETYGYNITDDDARAATRGRIEASLIRGLRYADGRTFQFIYE